MDLPLGDGIWNVGIGTFTVNRKLDIDHRALFREWTARLPRHWHIDDDHADGPLRGHALPTGLSRRPQYARGVLLTGDAAGMINPITGEGIDYALESGRLSAEIITQALARSSARRREQALHAYPQALKDAFGSYFTLGRLGVQLTYAQPRLVQSLTTQLLHRPALRRLALKLSANLTDPRGKDATDRIISALLKLTPAA